MKIALFGAPNSGKSSLYNFLTGSREHVGNWAGKTVGATESVFRETGDTLRDLPGTYSIFPDSEDERIAIGNGLGAEVELSVVVGDATALTKSLSLCLEVLPFAKNAILFLNFADEAEREKKSINKALLEMNLGIPVVIGSVRQKRGLDTLLSEIAAVKAGTSPQNKRLNYLKEYGVNLSYSDFITKEDEEKFLAICYKKAEALTAGVTVKTTRKMSKLDRLLTSRVGGKIASLFFLSLILYITIVLANYPSDWLLKFFSFVNSRIAAGLTAVGMNPFWLGLLTDGVLGVTSVVLSVMIPPMAIFFPLFAFFEEAGIFPRFAYTSDGLFRHTGASGKQCLTMCMGLGCNAAGVTQCRIIPERSHRLKAIYTNTFMPCNGRFPTIILIAGSFFFGGNVFIKALSVVAFMILGFVFTLGVNAVLSVFMRPERKEPYVLEMTKLRRPSAKHVLVDTFFEKTLKLLWRALLVSLPVGALIYLLAHINVGNLSLLTHFASFLDPFGRLLGLDGTSLSAFILALPANEIVLPVLTLGYGFKDSFLAAEGLVGIGEMLALHGWNGKRALIFLVFVLLHSPCSTTLITVYKETGRLRDTLAAFLIPTVTAVITCLVLNAFLPVF